MQEPLSTNVSATQKVLIKPVVEHFDEHADMCAINIPVCQKSLTPVYSLQIPVS